MAVTRTTELADSVKPLYVADYLLAAQPRLYWQQLAWQFDQMGARRGNSVNFPIYESMTPATSTIAEDTDITPVTVADTEFSMTFGEYANGVTTTEFLSATAYTDTEKAIAQLVGYNLAESLDLIIRPLFCQGAHVIYANGATRTGMTKADKISYGFLTRAIQFARGRNVPAFDDGFYLTIAHPNLIYDLQQDPVIQNAFVHNAVERMWNGEVGSIQGLRIISASNGRVFYGVGSTSDTQASTTLNGGVSAGATSVTVTSATGLDIGDYITIGSLETGATEFSTTEQVQITAVAGAVLTIVGEGNSQSNAGLKFAHSNGAVVVEAPNVYALPIVGPQSVAQASSDHTGPLGELRFTGPFDVLGRQANISWYGIWAFGRVSEKWLLRLECSGTY